MVGFLSKPFFCAWVSAKVKTVFSRRWRWPAAAFVFLSIFTLSLPACVFAQQSLTIDQDAPDMSGVNDVLGGQHYLLENDDLAMLQVADSNGNLNTQVVTMNTSNSQISGSPQTTTVSSFNPNGAFNPNGSVLAAIGTGRMYNTKSDVIASLTAGGPSGGVAWWLTILDPLTHFQYSGAIHSRFQPYGTVFTQLVMGDFTGDELSDPLLFYSSYQNGHDEWGMQIFTAADPDTEAAPAEGPELYGNQEPVPVTGTIVAGDFNNSGHDEIAALLTDYQTIAFYSVDPKTLAITQTSTIKLPVTMTPGQVTLAAGRFRDCGTGTCQTNDDLAVVGQIANSPYGYSVIPIQITPQSNGTFTAQVMSQSGSTPFFRFPDFHGAYGVIAQAAPLANWPKQTNEQLVIGIKTEDGAGYIHIGTFRQTGTNTSDLGQFDWESSTELNQAALFTYLLDMHVGNFDHQNSDGTPNTGWQVEALTLEVSFAVPEMHARIYNVTVPSPFPPPGQRPGNWLSQQSNHDFGASVAVNPAASTVPLLLPGDFQGRSLRLGSPTIVTIPTQVQPDLILGIPPMHVAWVAPNVDTNTLNEPGCTSPHTPCVMNLTVRPSEPPSVSNLSFDTSFNFSTSSTSEAKQSSTTSWGISVKQTAGTKVSFGDGLSGSSLNIRNTAKYAHDHSVKDTYDHYAGKTTKMSATTVFSDYVMYSMKTMNVYYYPVLGQQVCPDGSASCAPDDEGQQYVEFSVPSQVKHAAMDGKTQWWYQPVHQPGNVLSYPLDKAQLQRGFADTIVPLTPDPPTCYGIGTPQSYETNWSSGSTTGTTVGSANSFSDDLSMSYTTRAGVKNVASGSFTYSLDIAGSTSLNSLNENSSSLSASQGVTVSEPSFNSLIDTCCGYGWADYVFGLRNAKNPPAQQPQDIVTDPDGNPIPGPNATNGPMIVGFLADVQTQKRYGPCSGTGSFSWWQQVYNKPDVALNHPSRWDWDKNHMIVSFNAPDQSGDVSPLEQPFYQMKGFFITKQGDTGPRGNMPSAVAGDQLNLTVRVYNYSLANTPDPVQVRIYGQLYCSSGSSSEPSCVDPSQSQPCAGGTLCGPSFEIGQTQIPGIPGFKSESDGQGSYLPDWTTATVPFDTTKYSGDYMVFWVVVWMQDASGNLVQEMPGHGLTDIPGPDITSILDVPIESHSNNVGLYGDYHQFYIAPQGSLPGSSQSPGSLESADLITFPQAALDQQVPVEITIHAGTGGPADHVNVAYYDGDPANGGSLLDFQQISHIAPGMLYTHRELFTPDSCGVHTIYATAWLDGQPQVETDTPINVTADPVALTQSLMSATERASISDPQLREGLLSWLSIALEEFQDDRASTGDLMLGSYVQELFNASNGAISGYAAGPLIGGAGSILGCGPLGFAISAEPYRATVQAGQTATFSIALTPTGGFKGPVAITCSGAPRNGACSVSSDTVTLDGVKQQQLTLTVVTGSGSVAAAGIAGKPPDSGFGFLEWLLMLCGALLAAALVGRARRKYAVWLCLLLAISIGGVIGCGAGGGGTTSPPGVYPIYVSAASGNVVQKTEVTLTVN